MTKVYLVVFETKGRIYDSEVFTNRRKAEQYKKYWEAEIKLDKWFENDKVYIVEKIINNWDYTKDANELEKELENL